MANYYRRMLAAGESVASKIGCEVDEYFVVDAGERVKIDLHLDPEQELLDKMATDFLEADERRGLIDSFGLTIDSPADRHNDTVTAMVLDLFNRETKEDFEEFCAKYGALAETPDIKAYIKSKLA